eukprot:CAMPEP_0196664284 /NCGR_PEP_ID=MMETSP1086-20130531/56536_1 /TAXON_ID=77921 /ORGANISM="Cyanoptyche  gloeocystis , Strain SAG4.97" /LENGTH=64 /DNA_ID=CAMNT_0042000535 /DNA_START=17 /DNA_END=213 /DNA_ORIENTATION=-
MIKARRERAPEAAAVEKVPKVTKKDHNNPPPVAKQLKDAGFKATYSDDSDVEKGNADEAAEAEE